MSRLNSLDVKVNFMRLDMTRMPRSGMTSPWCFNLDSNWGKNIVWLFVI